MGVEDEYKDWVYRFRIERPVHRDATILMAVRDRFVDGQWQSEHLLNDGWHAHREWELLDIDSMPTMTGMQMVRERGSMRYLVEQVTAALQADAGADAKVVYVDE